MKHQYNWDLEYLDQLMPWQRDMYIDMTMEEIQKEIQNAQR